MALERRSEGSKNASRNEVGNKCGNRGPKEAIAIIGGRSRRGISGKNGAFDHLGLYLGVMLVTLLAEN